jgi:DNA-binding NarL/FixJ family response regulator
VKHGKGWRILIADDQKRTRESLRALLNATLPAPEIWEACSGREAVRLAEERQPDLILMDVRMPEGDGLEATRTIKSRWPGIRIVVLSMYLAYREEARAAGADAFVSKGEPPERLLAVLREQQPGGRPVG